MSRSRKKSPCVPWCGTTNKESKRVCNRLFRRIARMKIKLDEEPPHRVREIMNVWDFATDGLAVWYNNLDKKWMRK